MDSENARRAVAKRPLVHLGWVLAHEGREAALREAHQTSARDLEKLLTESFPMFEWRVDDLVRRRYAAEGLVEPLDMLEIGLHEKTEHQWDYALVITPNQLRARQKAFTLGVPSSALKTAVLSTAWFRDPKTLSEAMTALALYFLGHMWGLPTSVEGAMKPPAEMGRLYPLPFNEAECRIIVDRLEDVADGRLEDDEKAHHPAVFVWKTFWADPKSILIDVVGYRPWRQPFQLAGLAAAASVTCLLLFLGAEAWELGVHSGTVFVMVASAASVTGASLFLYFGQRLGELTRSEVLLEQLVRARIVLFLCLLAGMAALWLMLFTVCLLITMTPPRAVIDGWLKVDVGIGHLACFSAFAAVIGVAAGALGGNLEDEAENKAKFFFDEES